MTQLSLFTDQGPAGLAKQRADKVKPRPVGAPYQTGSRTSKAAAKAIAPKLGHGERAVLEFLEARNMHGATDEEMQRALDYKGSYQRPRRVRLVELGYVVNSGRSRKTASGRAAVVWVVARMGSDNAEARRGPGPDHE